MLILLILALILALFFWDLVSLLLTWHLKSQRIDEGPWVIPLAAEGRLVPNIFLTSIPLSPLTLKGAWRGSLFLSQEFWDSLSPDEKGTLLTWAYAANFEANAWRRLLGFFSPFKVDRQSLLIGAKGLALISLLEASLRWRATKSDPWLNTVLTGLGCLGPSWLISWPSFEERKKNITDQLVALMGEG